MKYAILLFFLLFFVGIIVFERNHSLQYMVDNSKFKTIEFPKLEKLPLAGQYPENKIFKKHVIYFWATWCPTCTADMPKLIEIIKNNSQAFFYLISVDSDMILLNKLISQIKPFPENLCFIEGDQGLASSMSTYRFPESYIFNEHKKYEQKLIGSSIVSDKMIQALLKRK